MAASKNIRIIRHEAVPQSRSFEVRFPDGRASVYFYFDDIPGPALSKTSCQSPEERPLSQQPRRLSVLDRRNNAGGQRSVVRKRTPRWAPELTTSTTLADC